MQIELRCDECGEIYSKSLHAAKRSRFCSKSCQSRNTAKSINLGTMGSRGYNKIVFSEEEEQNILTYYEEGLYIKEIAEKYNVSTKIISRVLKKHNKNEQYRRKGGLKITPEVVERAIELYKSGLSVQSVANELEVGKTALYTILKEKGITETNRRNPHNKGNKK